MNTSDQPIWTPSDEAISNSGMTAYMSWLERERGLNFDGYGALWQWSVDRLEDFWGSLWDYFEVRSSTPYTQVLNERKMPGASWFPGALVNFAAPVFTYHRDEPNRPAIIHRSEIRPLSELSWGELQAQVAAVAGALKEMGIKPGDRVVSYMPNLPETVIAFYACASIGAVWSSCSPDMGHRSVIDRFRQIEPKVMFAVDGYRYGGKDFDRRPQVQQIRDALPSLEQVVLLRYLDPAAEVPDVITWNDLLQASPIAAPADLPFDHPLWIVYSSGTTGMPKPIVHGHGGALLETLKNHTLHLDLKPDDRFMWFSTTGWIMWNSQIGGTLVGATICIYDGNPGYPDIATLWEFARDAKLTFFGAGAAFFQNCAKLGYQPPALDHLRTVGSTGSPLPLDTYGWLSETLGRHVLIAPISGGTDVAAAFVGSCPILPVYAGEMQCRLLGVAAYALDDDGNELSDGVGELVIKLPMPSMPLYFWNDTGGVRYHESYFDTYPGWWRHGDWMRVTPRGGAVIYGRSDTTINRHGIRMGTSEIYRVVEGFDEIADSLVVDLEFLGKESHMPLFVVLRAGAKLDDQLKERLVAAIRSELSARHVPNEIIEIASVPRTLTGKKMELPVKKIFLGMEAQTVASADAMANPESLQAFEQLAAERQRRGAETKI